MGSSDGPCSERLRTLGSDFHCLLGTEGKRDSKSRHARSFLVGMGERSLHISLLHFLLNLPNVANIERRHAERRKVHARKNLRVRTLDSNEEMGRPNLVLFLPKSCKESPVEC